MKPILLALLMAISTAPAERVLSVELTLQTRGTRKSVTITPAQTVVQINEAQRQERTTPARWRAVVQSLSNVPLNRIATLEVLADKQAVDAAFAATLRVKTDRQTYESTTFDYPNAPELLKPLLKAIRAGVPKADQSQF